MLARRTRSPSSIWVLSREICRETDNDSEWQARKTLVWCERMRHTKSLTQALSQPGAADHVFLVGAGTPQAKAKIVADDPTPATYC